MTIVQLRPDATTVNTGALTGGASAHAVLSDNSDASYVTYDVTERSQVTLGNLTLPAGAIVQYATTKLRGMSFTTGVNMSLTAVPTPGSAEPAGGFVYPSLTTPTTYYVGPSATDWNDTAADSAYLVTQHQGPSGSTTRVYELYLEIQYVTQPVVASVDTPTGTVTDTNQPTVTWTNTLDTDGGGQAFYEVKIFSDAQYLAGGFSADTSTTTADSGITTGAEQSWHVDTILPDDTYRAYVRIAQNVNGTAHWSAWTFGGFVINVALPAVPTLTLTAQSTSGRIKVDMNDNAGTATTTALELQRSTDGGTTWEPVRNSQGDTGIYTGTDLTVYDYETPNGTLTSYRARALHLYTTVYGASAWTATGTATWTSTDCWLKHPNHPALNLKLAFGVMLSYVGHSSAGRQGVFMPLGATLPIVVADTRGGPVGSFAVGLTTAADRADLDALLATSAVLLLQTPGSAEPDRYIMIGDHSRERMVDKSYGVATRETLNWVEVMAPPGAITGVEWS